MDEKKLEEAKKQLSEEQYNVCFLKGTEPPFSGKYTNNFEEGMYYCVVCGEPLFESGTKFHSDSGWPSFWDVLEKGNIKEELDESHGMIRTEVLCNNCGAHLGHVFDDGPRDKTGLRYCINSLALNFIPKDSSREK